jgi:hypothetical protein
MVTSLHREVVQLDGGNGLHSLVEAQVGLCYQMLLIVTAGRTLEIRYKQR